MAKTEAQKRADKKWEEKNREKRNYAKKKSSAKSFINVATKEDLEELKKLIEERSEENE